MTTIPTAKAHRLAPLRTKPAGQLLIHEIYRSVQGESSAIIYTINVRAEAVRQ